MRVLYLSYDGALDPLGRSQVVTYIEGLSARGHRFDLVTWEKPARWANEAERASMRERLAASEIEWHPLVYHKRPPVLGTGMDLARGLRVARAIVRRRGVELVHSRSYPATVIALRLRRRSGVPYLFDMRGLYAEERVDGGLWPKDGALYRLTRRLETAFFRHASGVVTLTRASVPEVRRRMEAAGSRAVLEVSTTAVDLRRFRPTDAGPGSAPPSGPRADAVSPEGTASRGLCLAYVGSIGTWYMLDEMLDFSRVVLEAGPDTSILFLVNEDPDWIRRRATERGVPLDRVRVESVSHERVPEALAGAHATFHFRTAPSRIASAPTKFGESLALGLPVVVNPGVGDAAEIVEEDRVGVVVPGFDPTTYRDVVERLRRLVREPDIGARCRASAESHFSLESAVEGYDRLYRIVAPAPATS